MSGIDLIPASYRKQAALRRTGRAVALASAALLGSAVASLLGLQWAIHHEETAMQAYQTQAERTASLQNDIRLLSEKKLRLEQTLSALNATQGTQEIPHALKALDAALNDDVWLQSLQVDRHREKMAAAHSSSDIGMLSTRKFVLLQHGSESWKIHRTLHLTGMATSYNAVADFIQALASQPGIAEAKLLNGGVMSGAQERRFAFSASAILLPGERLLP